MDEVNVDKHCKGLLIQGKLREAMEYIKSELKDEKLYERYCSIFEKEEFLVYGVSDVLEKVLRSYQEYYRNVFYLLMDEDGARKVLFSQLAEAVQIDKNSNYTDEAFEMVEEKISKLFEKEGYQFLPGITSGHMGPYIWKDTKEVTYDVEIPNGLQPYTVRILDGFLMRSWLDYISFGKTGTGGWASPDGILNCVKKCYDFDKEEFLVSFLKHEAQHTYDYNKYKNLLVYQLEYRAKLVELIYSKERNLLVPFSEEADGSNKDNSHAYASYKIIEGFKRILGNDSGKISELSINDIQNIARILFEQNEHELAEESKVTD